MMRPSRLLDSDVIKAIRHNEALRATPDTEVDFDKVFAEAPRKRHKWGSEKFGGSFVRHDCVSICKVCGLERHRQFDYGQRRTIFREPKSDTWFLNGRGWSAPTPSCR